MQENQPGWPEWCELCAKLNTAEDLNLFFEFFLTFEEREAIAGRYRITKALLAGEESQRQIAAHQQVSIAKITRGSNQLKQIDKKLKCFLTEHCAD